MREFRPTNFRILPPVIKNLIIINVLVFLASQATQRGGYAPMDDLFSLHTWQSPFFKPWQFVTHLFMHGSVGHIFLNMLALWMFGSVLENLWGPKRFLTFYLICGLGAALTHMTVLYFESKSLLDSYNALVSNFNFGTFENFFVKEHMADYYKSISDNAKNDTELKELYNNIMNMVNQYRMNPHNISLANQASSTTQQFVSDHINEPTLGASGAIFGCLAAFGYLFPNTYIYIYFFLPLKAKWFVFIYAALELVSGLQNSAGDNVAHFAHLGGALFGLALVYFWNKTNRQTFY